ncbi:hypothetical protein, partial [Litorimonas sp.]|uniref:hypothetical protein n=1 Tax=Litorimonas sp. TaxID=1892381 RepID=UPI003A888E73
TNGMLRILIQSAAGQEIDDVETDVDVKEEEGEASEEASEEEHQAADPPHDRYRASKMTYSCSLIDGKSDDSENMDCMLSKHSGTKDETEHRAFPDSGANTSVMSEKTAKMLHLAISETESRLFNASGEPMNVTGESFCFIRCEGGRQRRCRVLVSSSISDSLIVGKDDLKLLGILHPEYPRVINWMSEVNKMEEKEKDENLPKYLKDVIDEFPDVFKDELDFYDQIAFEPIHLEMKNNAKPYKTTRARQTPLAWQREADRMVQTMLENGTIRKLSPNENTEWLSPAHFVEKSEIGRLRFVCDFRNLNKSLSRPIHPFPSRDEVMKSIPAKAKYFFKADMTQGYHQ